MAKTIPVGNTYGTNVFRDVRIQCTRCQGQKRGMMQCDTGVYEWDCALCLDKTPHRVTERRPFKFQTKFRFVDRDGTRTAKFTVVMNREQMRRFVAGGGEGSPIFDSLKKQLEQNPNDSTYKVSVTGELANLWVVRFMGKGAKL